MQPYTPYPHTFHERLFPLIDSLSELKVTMAIMRKTLGWGKTEDEISFTQFMSMTGLSRSMVKSGIEAGLARGSIVRRAERNTFIYSVDLDAEYTSKKGHRGEHLNQQSVHSMNQQTVQTMNQFIDSTSSDNEPLSVHSMNQQSVHTMNTQKKDSKENIKKENMAHSRPLDLSIEDYYKGLLKRIEAKTDVPLTETGTKKTAAGVLTEMITDIWGGTNDIAQVATLAKEVGGIWKFYEFILKQPSKAPNGNVVSWLMACYRNSNKGNANGRNQLGRTGKGSTGSAGSSPAGGDRLSLEELSRI